jgi:hypothetical protein
MSRMGSMNAMDEHEITLKLVATSVLPREALEDMVLQAQMALESQAKDLALGAAASANFAENSVEVDFVLTASSAAELYERVAAVIRVLENAGFNNAGAPMQKASSERFALSSSSTHAVWQAVCA